MCEGGNKEVQRTKLDMKPKREVHVTVAGLSATGKTTVALALASALEDAGIEFDLVDEPDGTTIDELRGERHDRKMEALEETTRVIITTKMLSRVPNE
jgi:adenylylsulfate kinase-like enzyme